MRAFWAYQPKKGIHISSFFSTKQASGSQVNWAKTSNMHWCLGATRAAPVGMCSRPRTSTRMPAMRKRAMTPPAQTSSAFSTQRRGPSSSGVMPLATTADQT